ncbi:Calcium permeable stress-gated cation channel 1 (AtCSC1) (Hyperosmolality-gated Ca2+ permeable channel 1.2) (AtOSCA1.2) [Durusdinium trenchii]|uniref:Calcium permeable stress-gated cation channel 1 (AtCSC1) (Hyperosmolality-gated Ca2+ permeable channel 1.2) (AtOSCA1.2) n=1 Tax=Durusdinium trenchii TaxID=1381693 RepID=A0ABP0PFV6_9DINO
MCIVIVPINSVLGGADEGDDHLSLAEMATIRENHPWLFYVHAVVVWLVCIIVHFVLTRAQARFLRLRVKWLTRMPAPRCTTVLVENIPCAWRSDARLREFFGKIFSPEDVLSCHMVKREEEIAKLVSKRETLQQMKRKAELTYEKTQQVEMFRPSFCGKKVETLEYCNSNLEGLDEEIRDLWQKHQEEHERDPTARTSHCGFVTFQHRRVAEMAQNLQISADLKDPPAEWNVSAAPVSRDIRWNDLRKSRNLSKGSVGFMPIVIFITNIAKLVHLGPLQPIWQGFAPTLGLLLFLSLLPTVLMIIFRTFFSLKDWADAYSQHKLQFWYFLFQLIFVVLVTTVGKSIVDRAKDIWNDPSSAPQLMAESLPNASHFYMTYLVLQWARHAMEMLRYVPLSKFLLFKTIFSAEEAKEMSEPEDQDCYGFGARNVNLAVNVVLGIVFCSISPLVTIMAMFDLALARITYGYLVIYTETKKPDLGGVFWATQIGYIQLALALYCIFMVGVLQAKSASHAWVVAAPSLLFVLWSFVHIRRAYRWEKLPFQEVAFQCEETVETVVVKTLVRGEVLDEKDFEDVAGDCYIQPELAALESVTLTA